MERFRIGDIISAPKLPEMKVTEVLSNDPISIKVFWIENGVVKTGVISECDITENNKNKLN